MEAKDTVIHADGCSTNLGVIGARCNCGAESQAEISFEAGIRELGKRLKQVRDESYDEQTFLADLDELIKLALDGKVLPPIVVECIETIWENPKFKKPNSRNRN